MNVLVTGGAGFIGSHICEGLVERGHRVYVIDNLSTGKKSNVAAEATLYELSLDDAEGVTRVLEEIRPEAIFHLAAQIDVRKSVEDPTEDARQNILGSLNLLEAARKVGVRHFIFSSSGGAIYGDTDQRPTTEQQSERPQSPYGIAKLAIDRYLDFYRLTYGMRTVSLRYGNVYGPRQNAKGEAGVIAIFLDKMLAGVPPVINGDGLQTRDFVFVKDVAVANILALEQTQANGTYNIGLGREITVNQVFQGLNALFGGRFVEQHAPAKLGEQRTSSLDASRLRNELGWSPATTFEDGLLETYEFFVKAVRA